MIILRIALVTVGLSGCATYQAQQPEVGTAAFVESTLRQYGIGPSGRVASPDAVVPSAAADTAVQAQMDGAVEDTDEGQDV